MAQNEQDNNKEVDLTQISRQMKRYYARANDSLFDGILFIQRNIILLAVIIITGAGLGVYLDSGTKTYSHKVFVIPNFESVNYLYEEVEHLNSKIAEGDSIYFKSLGIKSPKKFNSVDIEPVIDIYNFLDDNDPEKTNRKFEVFRLIAEQGDVKKVLEEDATGRNYKVHMLTINTHGTALEKDIIEPLLKHFNANPYFVEMQQEYISNNEIKLRANDQMIKQIDSVVSNFSKGARNKSSGLIYYNDNTQINELFNIKNRLLREQADNRIKKQDYIEIIKPASIVPNIVKEGITSGKKKFIIPFLFVLIFISILKFRRFYKKKSLKRQIA
ncbi:MAG: hypothetical protein V4581_15510 [Bacteroidota bacterium]